MTPEQEETSARPTQRKAAGKQMTHLTDSAADAAKSPSQQTANIFRWSEKANQAHRDHTRSVKRAVAAMETTRARDSIQIRGNTQEFTLKYGSGTMQTDVPKPAFALTQLHELQQTLASLVRRFAKIEKSTERLGKIEAENLKTSEKLNSVLRAVQARIHSDSYQKESFMPLQMRDKYRLIEFDSFEQASAAFLACIKNTAIGKESVEIGVDNNLAILEDKYDEFLKMRSEQNERID